MMCEMGHSRRTPCRNSIYDRASVDSLSTPTACVKSRQTPQTPNLDIHLGRIQKMNLITKILSSLRSRGVIKTAVRIISHVIENIRARVDSRFDRKFDVDTSGIIEPSDLDITNQQRSVGHRYEPTPVSAIQVMLGNLTITHSEYSFIDFGSGKGRLLLLAARYPWQRIIGVEFSQRLHEVAKSNIERWTDPQRQCTRIDSILGDARAFKLPHTPLVLFFFTPFTFPVFEQVVDNIQRSLFEHPRPMQILYYGSRPDFVGVLAKLDFSHKIICPVRRFSAINQYEGHLFWKN